ncbi:hypothetical protein CRG98_003388 [Punica granatum]|uniref:Nucleoside phosphorylase domain-containing protein n=1 Tax=Punica granatum TaxID=22663 RepID=A0A2I0L6E7_PUNGR|nr:hypothetical protein CRG98_003388 [Punica granatum]
MGQTTSYHLSQSGDFNRKIGALNISEYNEGSDNKDGKSNLLNNVWLQEEEIYPINGIPEQRQHVFWVPVDKHYFAVSEKLKDLKLENCVNKTSCLPRPPVVVRVERGITANIYLDNRAYREFIYSKLKATTVDMETAAVALICYQQRTPFIALRSLSDLAGRGSALSNEASTFSNLAAQNAVDALIKFVALLGS